MPTIVVGVDGSRGAEAALRFALSEAKLREADLRIVCGWSVPTIAYTGGYAVAEFDTELEENARRVVDGAAAEARSAGSGNVEALAVNAQPAEALLGAAHDAELLVVGSRGRGGFASLMLGSVSQQVAHHARIPVAIVPSPDDPG